MPNNRKVILRISDLKQWFPLKKKGLYVKANDGISIDIYEGETFGLVGESGCGKSTLGRTILQFYKQTDGRTIYYGKSVDEVAPVYVQRTLQTLGKRRSKYEALKVKRDAEQATFDKLDETAKMAEKDKLRKTVKEANDAFMDIAMIIGGFMIEKNLKPIADLFLQEYAISKKIKAAKDKKQEAELDLADIEYALKQAKEAGKATSKLESKMKSNQEKVASCDAKIYEIQAELTTVREEIDQKRLKYADNEEFQRIEKYRDDGIDLERLTYNEMRLLRSDLQLIFQDPYSSLNPRMSVGQIVGEGMLTHKMFHKDDGRMQEHVLHVMEQCGLAPYFIHRFPHQFSGGQRQRIGIARSLAVNPKFVVCDEAVSALDVSIQSQIINLLQDLKEEKNLTYLFITHDLSVVKYISDRIGVMYLGTIVELSDAQEIFDHPIHPYTETLLAAIPTTDVGDSKKPLSVLEGDIPSPVNPPKGCKFHTRCKYCTDICTQVTPEWEEISPNHFVACHHKRLPGAKQ